MCDDDLTSCPECGADLGSVTSRGACALCGFEFDEHTRIWRGRRTWHHHSVIYGLLGLAVGLLVVLAYRVSFDEVPNPLLPVAAAVAVAAAGLIVDRALTGRLSGRFVATTPRGVLVGTRRRSRLVPWNDVGRLRTRGRTPRLLRRSDGVTIPLEDVFESAEAVEAFRRAVEQGRLRR